jgi:hypothetical protein
MRLGNSDSTKLFTSFFTQASKLDLPVNTGSGLEVALSSGLHNFA